MINDAIPAWVDSYNQQGWHIFPVHGYSRESGCTCGDPGCPPKSWGKHPATKKGVLDATADPDKVAEWFHKGDRNIGLATGALSGVFVVDVDGPEGERSLRKLEEEHGPLPATRISLTGRGRHFFFLMPDGEDIRNSTSMLGNKVDIRGTGGYVILPPSAHQSGLYYTWENPSASIVPAPQWLLNRVVRKAAPQQVETAERSRLENGSHQYKLVQSMLTALDPDMPYDDWVKVGMAVKASGADLQAWDEWSSAGEKYDQSEMQSKWASFSQMGGITDATLEFMARERGWTNPFTSTIIVDLSPPRAGEEPPAETPRPEWPINAVTLPGMIGDTVRWIVRSSLYPQPELALLATLSCLSAVCGRKYATPINTRPNVYIAGLAPTGSGKDHARKMMKTLLSEALLSQYIGAEEFISAPGVLRSLTEKPSQVMLVDEIGLVFKSLAGENTPSFKREVATLLLRAYSSSGSPSFSGGVYANEKAETKIVDYPSLSIYGTSTEDMYAQSLTRSMVASGELNRWIVLPSKEGRPKRNRDLAGQEPTPAGLAAQWARIGAVLPEKRSDTDVTSVDSAVGCPDPILVSYGPGTADEVELMFDEQDDRLDTGGEEAALWGRYGENSLKISMLFAIARNPEKPSISVEDLQTGRALVKMSILYVLHKLDVEVSENSHEKATKRVLLIIKKAGDKGVTRTALARKTTNLSPQIRKQVLDDLLEQDRVELVDNVSTGGRPSSSFRYRS